jgi:class 3 adenylate cyclase
MAGFEAKSEAEGTGEAGRAAATIGSPITLVFVDLVNSTALKAALPGGDVTARNRAYFETILTPYRQRVEADLAVAGGRVVKTSGDDHFLVFASAARAAQWAAALQARQRAEAIMTPLGPLQVRIGMHTGAPLTDPQDESDYIGHEVDYAKRVSALASGGQILLSEITAVLVRDARIAGLALHAHGERELKGIGRVPLFELLPGEKRPQPLEAAASPLPLAPGETSELPTAALLETLVRSRIVGRDAELAELKRRVDAALQGVGSTVFLSGEPEIGKTRLATETALYARLHGFQVLTGRCEEEGAAPYQPFAEAVREYLNSAGPARLEQALPPPVACELVRIVPPIASKVKEVPQVPPLPAEQARQALLEAAQQFFTAIATQEALLLFLDDLHWVEEGSLVLLHHLARHGKILRLLIVGTYRDVELDTRHPLERTLSAMNRERLYQRLSLRRLPEAGVGEMVAALLADSTLPAAFISALHHETEGNPFFIEEVLKHLVEERAIYREQGRWQIKAREEISVPQSIKVTIGRRLERLSEESREVLTLAAVIGQQFSFEGLLQASGLEEERLLEMVEEWLGAHLVVEQRREREELYHFQHAQIREVPYEALSLRRKARLHERVGLALEAVSVGALDERDELGLGGLLVWKDVLNYLRLDKFSMDPWHHGNIGLEGRIRGEYRTVGRGLRRGHAFHLRLERTGERFAALCSIDGIHWLTCGQVVLPVKDPLRVGVWAGGGMVVHFDYVQVLGRE